MGRAGGSGFWSWVGTELALFTAINSLPLTASLSLFPPPPPPPAQLSLLVVTSPRSSPWRNSRNIAIVGPTLGRPMTAVSLAQELSVIQYWAVPGSTSDAGLSNGLQRRANNASPRPIYDCRRNAGQNSVVYS